MNKSFYAFINFILYSVAVYILQCIFNLKYVVLKTNKTNNVPGFVLLFIIFFFFIYAYFDFNSIILYMYIFNCFIIFLNYIKLAMRPLQIQHPLYDYLSILQALSLLIRRKTLMICLTFYDWLTVWINECTSSFRCH